MVTFFSRQRYIGEIPCTNSYSQSRSGPYSDCFLRKSNSGGAISWKVGEGGNGRNP